MVPQQQPQPPQPPQQQQPPPPPDPNQPFSDLNTLTDVRFFLYRFQKKHYPTNLVQ